MCQYIVTKYLWTKGAQDRNAWKAKVEVRCDALDPQDWNRMYPIW